MLTPYTSDHVFSRTDSGDKHPKGIYSFGEQDGYIVNNHALYSDILSERTKTESISKFPFPLLFKPMTIDKFSLAKDLAEGVGVYPFALASKYGVDAGHAKLLVTGPLKGLDFYLTWQDDWKNYSGIDWWGAQGINISVPLISKMNEVIISSVIAAMLTDSPTLGAVAGVIASTVAGEAESQATKKVKEKFLKDNDTKQNEKENNQYNEQEGGKQ